MHSADSDAAKSDVPEFPKLPFKRLKYALNQVVNVAIPLHVQLLQQQSKNIQELKSKNIELIELELHSEQVKAAKTVQLLKADLFELERLNIQVKDEDKDLFNQTISHATNDAVDVLSNFMDLHSDVLTPFPEQESDATSSVQEFPPLVCNFDEESPEVASEGNLETVSKLELKPIVASKYTFESLSFIQKELIEINSLIKQFALLVFRQKDSVDTIQNNIEQTNENVYLGAKYLKKASDYKAAVFPIAGAVIGGILLGPVGALAGLKLSGSIACVATGGVLGYGAGVKLKKKQQASNDIEMKALTYPSKSQSRSTPDLSVEFDSNNKS